MEDLDFALSAIFEARHVVSIVDTMADTVTFLKMESQLVPLNVPVGFTEFIRDYLARAWVHPDDVAQFDALLNLDNLRDFCRKQRNGGIMNFRRMRDGKIRWAKILVNVPADFSEEKPKILMCLRYLSDQEQEAHDAYRTMSKTILKVAKIDFSSGESRLLKIPRGEDQLRSRYRAAPGSSDTWEEEESFVHPDDLPEFRQITNREHICAWYRAGNIGRSVYYRRKMGGRYRWVKLMISPASDYSAQREAFLFYIVDVHRPLTTFNTNQRKNAEPSRGAEDQELYNENLLNALAFFTQKYRDCYVVDLRKDRYLKYKVDRSMLTGNLPHVGCYSATAARILSEVEPCESGENLGAYASLDTLRMILEDKVSFEYSFMTPDGKRCRTICTRIESENSIPIKMLVRVEEVEQDDRLRVKTFGSFEVYDRQGRAIAFHKKKSKQLLAYLVDKYGFPAATADIVQDVLEKEPTDLNAKKYVSTLFRMAEKDLENAGFPGIIMKEWNSLRVDADKLDCDYYHLMEGDVSYWSRYHNEYMKEYSWAEETNAEILHYGGI